MYRLVRLSVSFFLLNSFLFNINAQNADSQKMSSFELSASYIGDVVSNFNGGIKRGTTYLGLINLKAGFDTEKAKMWKGGKAFVNLGNTHGGEPSATFVGDFQGVSNIEAGNLTFLYELWYKQQVGNVSFAIGLQDLNSEFALSENGGLFTNSSFGIQSSISDNIPTPIFPLTALGVKASWDISSQNKLQLAIFDGTPDDFQTNPYNTEWKLSENDGYLAVAEYQLNKSMFKGLNGSYKFGTYYHHHKTSENNIENNGGAYLIIDQNVSSKMAVFSQIGFSPSKLNNHNRYFSFGVNLNDIIKNRPNDIFGFALAYAGINGNSIGSETALELTYKISVCDRMYIRPDIQYVINPAGTGVKLDNALVGFIRVGLDF